MKIFCISPGYAPPPPLLPTVYIQANENPRPHALRAANILGVRPVADRCLDVRYPVGHPSPDATTILTRGWPVTGPAQWWMDFWQTLQVNLKPAPGTSPIALAACDYEDNALGQWNIRGQPEAAKAIWGDPAMVSRLPENLRDRATINWDAWDDFGFSLRAMAMRKAMCDTFCRVFGTQTAPVGNYDDSMGLRRDGLSRKVWQATASNIDMPECYIRRCSRPGSTLPDTVQGLEQAIEYGQSSILPDRKAWPWIETSDAHELGDDVPVELRRELWKRRTRIFLRLPFAGLLLWRGGTSKPAEDQVLVDLVNEAQKSLQQ